MKDATSATDDFWSSLTYSIVFFARFSKRQIVLTVVGSSVARGGGGGGLEPPPHWLVKCAKSYVFGAFEADFL